MKKIFKFTAVAALALVALLAAPSSNAQARYDSSYAIMNSASTAGAIQIPGGVTTNVGWIVDCRLQDKITLQIDVGANTNGASTLAFPIQRSGDGTSYSATMETITLSTAAYATTFITNVPSWGVGWLKIVSLANGSASGTYTNIVVRPILKRNAP